MIMGGEASRAESADGDGEEGSAAAGAAVAGPTGGGAAGVSAPPPRPPAEGDGHCVVGEAENSSRISELAETVSAVTTTTDTDTKNDSKNQVTKDLTQDEPENKSGLFGALQQTLSVASSFVLPVKSDEAEGKTTADLDEKVEGIDKDEDISETHEEIERTRADTETRDQDSVLSAMDGPREQLILQGGVNDLRPVLKGEGENPEDDDFYDATEINEISSYEGHVAAIIGVNSGQNPTPVTQTEAPRGTVGQEMRRSGENAINTDALQIAGSQPGAKTQHGSPVPRNAPASAGRLTSDTPRAGVDGPRYNGAGPRHELAAEEPGVIPDQAAKDPEERTGRDPEIPDPGEWTEGDPRPTPDPREWTPGNPEAALNSDEKTAEETHDQGPRYPGLTANPDQVQVGRTPDDHLGLDPDHPGQQDSSRFPLGPSLDSHPEVNQAGTQLGFVHPDDSGPENVHPGFGQLQSGNPDLIENGQYGVHPRDVENPDQTVTRRKEPENVDLDNGKSDLSCSSAENAKECAEKITEASNETCANSAVGSQAHPSKNTSADSIGTSAVPPVQQPECSIPSGNTNTDVLCAGQPNALLPVVTATSNSAQHPDEVGSDAERQDEALLKENTDAVEKTGKNDDEERDGVNQCRDQPTAQGEITQGETSRGNREGFVRGGGTKTSDTEIPSNQSKTDDDDITQSPLSTNDKLEMAEIPNGVQVNNGNTSDTEEPPVPKGTYNLDFLDKLDDPNFDPFKSNTKMTLDKSESTKKTGERNANKQDGGHNVEVRDTSEVNGKPPVETEDNTNNEHTEGKAVQSSEINGAESKNVSSTKQTVNTSENMGNAVEGVESKNTTKQETSDKNDNTEKSVEKNVTKNTTKQESSNTKGDMEKSASGVETKNVPAKQETSNTAVNTEQPPSGGPTIPSTKQETLNATESTKGGEDSSREAADVCSTQSKNTTTKEETLNAMEKGVEGEVTTPAPVTRDGEISGTVVDSHLAKDISSEMATAPDDPRKTTDVLKTAPDTPNSEVAKPEDAPRCPADVVDANKINGEGTQGAGNDPNTSTQDQIKAKQARSGVQEDSVQENSQNPQNAEAKSTKNTDTQNIAENTENTEESKKLCKESAERGSEEEDIKEKVSEHKATESHPEGKSDKTTTENTKEQPETSDRNETVDKMSANNEAGIVSQEQKPAAENTEAKSAESTQTQPDGNKGTSNATNSETKQPPAQAEAEGPSTGIEGKTSEVCVEKQSGVSVSESETPGRENTIEPSSVCVGDAVPDGKHGGDEPVEKAVNMEQLPAGITCSLETDGQTQQNNMELAAKNENAVSIPSHNATSV